MRSRLHRPHYWERLFRALDQLAPKCCRTSGCHACVLRAKCYGGVTPCDGCWRPRSRRFGYFWCCSHWVVLGVAACVVATTPLACLTNSCTEAGCTSGISAWVSGTPVGASLVRACLDTECLEVPWPATCEAESKPPLRLSVCSQDDGVMVRLEFGPGVETANGASFQLSIEDAGGVPILQETESVKFRNSYPNGEDCPGHCRYANFRY